MPLRSTPGAKMLEIGLGCGMKYGAGASANLWRVALPEVELWEAEINVCAHPCPTYPPSLVHPCVTVYDRCCTHVC